MYTLVKVLLTALIIVGSSELAKRWSLASTLLLALPFTSLLAILWIYIDTKDVAKVAEISWGIFWLVPPSLVFFPVLAVLLQRGLAFPYSLISAITAAVLTYIIYVKILARFGIQL
ncbi:MAG: DUF3147 family protein [Proteobacteria bacterium]|nr:MAG: DUF3147 family protein [Pseudomonadota bacterium]